MGASVECDSFLTTSCLADPIDRARLAQGGRSGASVHGEVSNHNILHADLIGPETVPRMDGKIQLESKEDMKRRGQPSPNRADCLALSFAYSVAKKRLVPRKSANPLDHDPLRQYENFRDGHSGGYDPFGKMG